MKFCKDCKHCYDMTKDVGYWKCENLRKVPSPVNGEPISAPDDFIYCEQRRSLVGACGPKGSEFEAREA